MEVQVCEFCLNASVDDELTSDNDLSFLPVGKILKEGYSMYIRSGANKPTALVISAWDKARQVNEDIAIYEMRYCPNCGRYLFENNKN